MQKRIYENLQRKKPGFLSMGQKWSLENIRDGLEYFHDLYGRYPTSKEVDQFDYLPHARSIQRSYGGLVKIRKQLNLLGQHNFTQGQFRSTKAREADLRARLYEEEFYKFLCTKFPEVYIHEHKVIRPGNVSSDFFIYTSKNSGVVLDLFYAADIVNISKIINIKYKRYLNVSQNILFILVGNDKISQRQIDAMISNRKVPLPTNMKVVTEIDFKTKFKLYLT